MNNRQHRCSKMECLQPWPIPTIIDHMGLHGIISMSCVVLMSAVLIVRIQLVEGLADIGRENNYQRMMLLIRCLVFLSHFHRMVAGLRQPQWHPELDRGWFVSVCSTTLWPRSSDFWGWCPFLLMAFNRTVLGLADAVERGRLGSYFSWVMSVRVWQHLACPVSVCVGLVFFHREPYLGLWRQLRNVHGQTPAQMLHALPSTGLLSLPWWQPPSKHGVPLTS
mmetsp:Transcript_54945/g.178576  ORF Transcript_54945/g.178576 Transcript_54945/m.178576 type:complete len:222 (+) Transcript_54945:685-1350(+)